jgi:hypothetical protein
VASDPVSLVPISRELLLKELDRIGIGAGRYIIGAANSVSTLLYILLPGKTNLTDDVGLYQAVISRSVVRSANMLLCDCDRAVVHEPHSGNGLELRQ